MPDPKKTTGKLSISLRENGLHSLSRGIEAYEEYDKSHEKLLLKDAIMFLHHGIELLMKEILVKHSAFLIFEDIRDASRKQKIANTSGLGIFFIEKPPKTVAFDEAISRVDAFIKPAELTDHLQSKLVQLNQLRNQLEHYAFEADVEEVTQLLASLHNPLIQLFEAQLGDIKRLQPPKVVQAWSTVQSAAKFYSELEEDVWKTVQQFKGQVVPGRLFGLEGQVTLPVFTQVLANPRVTTDGGRTVEVDVLCEGEDLRWIIEVKGGSQAHRALSALDQLFYLSSITHAQPWLVIFADASPHFRQEAKQRNIMLTDEQEWQELKSLVQEAA